MTHVHFIGIGGTGLSAIARLLLEMGTTISGSDRVLSPFAAKLQADGATIYIGHRAENVAGADWVVRSSAIPDDNPEVMEAQARGIPVYKRAETLGRLMQDKIGIAVAGTHGKTTTTAMIAWTLHALGRDPSFIVGSEISNLNTNAHAGQGNTFVIKRTNTTACSSVLNHITPSSPASSTTTRIATPPSGICTPPLRPLPVCSPTKARSSPALMIRPPPPS